MHYSALYVGWRYARNIYVAEIIQIGMSHYVQCTQCLSDKAHAAISREIVCSPACVAVCIV